MVSQRMMNRVNELEVRQLEYQRSTDERFDKVFLYIEDHAESEQKIFRSGLQRKTSCRDKTETKTWLKCEVNQIKNSWYYLQSVFLWLWIIILLRR